MMTKNELREFLTDHLDGKDFFELVIGDSIANGSRRKVFDFRLDNTCVIKYQYAISSYDNIIEWQLYHDLEGHPNQKWLAPCVSLSPNGVWLVQKKTKPLPKNYKFPDRVPEFFADLKDENFGLYKGRLVCHDYANNHCLRYARNNKTRKYENHLLKL